MFSYPNCLQEHHQYSECCAFCYVFHDALFMIQAIIAQGGKATQHSDSLPFVNIPFGTPTLCFTSMRFLESW